MVSINVYVTPGILLLGYIHTLLRGMYDGHYDGFPTGKDQYEFDGPCLPVVISTVGIAMYLYRIQHDLPSPDEYKNWRLEPYHKFHR